uniref:Uncharacterized protein n=1 Tax=Nelumbo nucifera TaxID=4432 RepID=A0A822XP78_NELNU|nr:TPA_asm: hypothetical protein HUJ06_023693 [Nelumbo nucifera]
MWAASRYTTLLSPLKRRKIKIAQKRLRPPEDCPTELFSSRNANQVFRFMKTKFQERKGPVMTIEMWASLDNTTLLPRMQRSKDQDQERLRPPEIAQRVSLLWNAQPGLQSYANERFKKPKDQFDRYRNVGEAPEPPLGSSACRVEDSRTDLESQPEL